MVGFTETYRRLFVQEVTVKSAAILAAGIVALALLAAICLPRHAPLSTASGAPIPANFHARVEYGTLILRGSLPNETSKAAILQRAHELYGATPGRVVDELAVDPRVGPVAWADNLSQVLPALGHMAERGSIIIDGRTIVVSGQVGSDRTKAAVLRDIAPLTQAGLELEDRILAGSFSAGRSMKTSSPKAPAPKAPAQTSSLVAAIAPKAPSLIAVSPSSLQKTLNEILARASIEFESNSTTMIPSNLATLEQLTDQLRRAPRTAIEIGGHTDKYGEPEYNLQLSHRRAEAVRRYFSKQGLTNQFTAVGYGASQPLSVSEKRAGLQRNRRIELRVKGQPEL
jgi:OmpA-OmpF porin, OOP family